MNQDERTRKSRREILDAALKLFSHQGYRGTSIRDIATAASLSTGNVYHHFPDKETIFNTLLGEYWTALESPDFPFNAALAKGAFPDDLEALGHAARESVRQYRPYVALIYVDVVEFEGTHIKKFYATMAQRFSAFLEAHDRRKTIEKKLRPEVDSLSAIMLASRIYLNHFAVEILFGVPDHFGKKSEETVKEIADILRHGLLRDSGAARAAPPANARLAARARGR